MRVVSTTNLNHDALSRTKHLTGSTDEQVLTAIQSGAPTLWSSATDAFRDYYARGSKVSKDTLLANVYRIFCGDRKTPTTSH
jgi:hypothetical protein